MSEQDSLRLGVDGEHTTGGVPHGSTSLTPFLAVAGAREAVQFYRDVFGARVLGVTEMGGVVVHAELDFGQGRLQLGEPNPDYGLVPAPAGEVDCYPGGGPVPGGERPPGGRVGRRAGLRGSSHPCPRRT